MCGTGGDKLQTFNVSTTASFVVAAAGGIVAKHGNRSTSGVSGSADIFEYFGYDLNQEPSQIVQILEKHKICFMFAQKFHPAMKHNIPDRKCCHSLDGNVELDVRAVAEGIGAARFERVGRRNGCHGDANGSYSDARAARVVAGV